MMQTFKRMIYDCVSHTHQRAGQPCTLHGHSFQSIQQIEIHYIIREPLLSMLSRRHRHWDAQNDKGQSPFMTFKWSLALFHSQSEAPSTSH